MADNKQKPSEVIANVVGWVDRRFPLTSTMKAHLTEYYAPKNFNFWYFFGALAMLVLVMQINGHLLNHAL
jgi:ubiquinol-cytochrome c reductase cytochrome b subunit